MIFTTASPTASSTRSNGRALSSGMSVSAAPNTSEKKITPSRSIPAAAWIGLRGTMFTNVSTPNRVEPAACSPCACERYVVISCSRTPGAGLAPEVREQLMTTYRSQAQGLQAAGSTRFGVETFVNMVPRNPIQAAAGMDLLGVIFFSLVFGAALTLIPEDKARPLLRVLDAVGEAVVKIIDLAMKLAPYGVFGLIFFTTSRFGWGLLRQLGLYVLIVVAGLLIHGTVSLSLLVRLFGGLDPRVFWSRISASIVTAFSTSSSNATLPTNIAVAEEELKIPPEIAGFVLPLGSTMCMNGTALYEGVTVLFLAQVFGVSLALGAQVVVLVLAVITAVGAAGVPGGSLPLLMVVLATVGVPAEGIAIILGVDRILDMCRTTINVCGDLTAAVYVARAEGEWDPRVVTREPARLQVA